MFKFLLEMQEVSSSEGVIGKALKKAKGCNCNSDNIEIIEH